MGNVQTGKYKYINDDIRQVREEIYVPIFGAPAINESENLVNRPLNYELPQNKWINKNSNSVWMSWSILELWGKENLNHIFLFVLNGNWALGLPRTNLLI